MCTKKRKPSIHTNLLLQGRNRPIHCQSTIIPTGSDQSSFLKTQNLAPMMGKKGYDQKDLGWAIKIT